MGFFRARLAAVCSLCFPEKDWPGEEQLETLSGRGYQVLRDLRERRLRVLLAVLRGVASDRAWVFCSQEHGDVASGGSEGRVPAWWTAWAGTMERRLRLAPSAGIYLGSEFAQRLAEDLECEGCKALFKTANESGVIAMARSRMEAISSERNAIYLDGGEEAGECQRYDLRRLRLTRVVLQNRCEEVRGSSSSGVRVGSL